jgi:hypothetical protein
MPYKTTWEDTAIGSTSNPTAFSRARGLLLEFKFMNNAYYTQSPFVASTVSSLEAASKKWDPEGGFQLLQNSGFLVSKQSVISFAASSFSRRGTRGRSSNQGYLGDYGKEG